MRKGAKYREAVLRKHEEKIDSDDSKERDDRRLCLFYFLLFPRQMAVCPSCLSSIFFGPPNIQNSFWGQAFPLVLFTPRPLEHLVISQYD